MYGGNRKILREGEGKAVRERAANLCHIDTFYCLSGSILIFSLVLHRMARRLRASSRLYEVHHSLSLQLSAFGC